MPIDFEAEYNNRARVPSHPGLIAGWAADAAAFRAARHHEAVIAYGPAPRQAFDLFPAASDSGGPAALFVHGGYWQALDRSFFSHLSAGANARGLAMAIPSYTLCPDGSVAGIVREMQQATLALWRRTGRRVVASGHSAGGHLAAMLLATDWPALDPDAPPDRVIGARAFSGLFDLVPLTGPSVNDKLGLTREEAARLSPCRLLPRAGTRLLAAVGGDESREYLRQSRLIADLWSPLGCEARDHVLPGENHFTVVAGLASADSALTEALVALAEGRPFSPAP